MPSARFLSRRTFLRGAAGVTLGLPLLESIGAGPLRAQEGAPLTRFLSFHSSRRRRYRSLLAGHRRSHRELVHGPGHGSSRSVCVEDPHPARCARLSSGDVDGSFGGHLPSTHRRAPERRAASGCINRSDHRRCLEFPGREALVMRPGGRDLGVNEFNSISWRGPGEMVDAESNPIAPTARSWAWEVHLFPTTRRLSACC